MQRRFITADEAIALLPEKEYIHTFYNTPPVLCGADWDKQEIIDKLKAADKIEIAGETARSMDHGLAVYNNDTKMQSEVLFVETDPEKLDAFDNPYTESDVELIIKIPKEALTNIKVGAWQRVHPDMLYKAIENGIPISDNATNGDIQKALYPNALVFIDEVVGIACFENDYDEFEMRCSLDWWNAPYQKGR